MAKSFFATLKVEFYYQQQHAGGIDTKHEIGEWIRFYNETRFHSALGYLPPAKAWANRTNTNWAFAT